MMRDDLNANEIQKKVLKIEHQQRKTFSYIFIQLTNHKYLKMLQIILNLSCLLYLLHRRIPN